MPSDTTDYQETPEIRENDAEPQPPEPLGERGKRAMQGEWDDNWAKNETGDSRDTSDDAIAEAAKQGAAEESGYINKIGRANERAAMHQLEQEGEQVSDLNAEVKKNHPVVDVSTDQRLVSVKGTGAETWDSQYSYLKSGFDDMYSMDEAAHAKRMDSAKELATHSEELNLPAEFKDQFADPANPSTKELSSGADYIRNHGEYSIPSDKVQPFKDSVTPHIEANPSRYDIKDPGQIDHFLDKRVVSNGVSSGRVKELVENS